MEVVKETEEFKIFKKRSGRYGVKNKKSKNKKDKWINGDEKAKILLDAGLIKLSPPKKKEEPTTEQEASADTADGAPQEAEAAKETKAEAGAGDDKTDETKGE